ncbi:MAG: OB-fold domain-containing protein [Chloroflexi bacterium]|nr:OB-fold domain-containing protein [Chloroflexota bacterium]
MTDKKQIPAVEGLFTWPSDEPRLIGARCKSCGEFFFPKSFPTHNPTCKNRELEEVLLSRRGKLWSYTVHHYPPPPPFMAPKPFVPFGIASVELPEGIKVLGMTTDCVPEKLKIGTEMEMVVEKLYEDKDGNEVMGWKFRPVPKQS